MKVVSLSEDSLLSEDSSESSDSTSPSETEAYDQDELSDSLQSADRRNSSNEGEDTSSPYEQDESSDTFDCSRQEIPGFYGSGIDHNDEETVLLIYLRSDDHPQGELTKIRVILLKI